MRFFQSKKIKFKEKTSRDLLNKLVTDPRCDWISQNRYAYSCFEGLFERFSEKEVRFFLENPVIFLPSMGHLSCALSKVSDSDLIIIFPDLMKLITGPAMNHAQGILAHELGHLFHQHSNKPISALEAQLEADNFAIGLGFSKELALVLEEQPRTHEIEARLMNIFSKNH